MAVIGCLGDIAFEVSDKTLKTITNMKWSGSAQYATHQRHAGNALTEFVGIDPDKMSFEIILSSYLGSDPMKETAKIFAYERSGRAVPLIIGSHAYGKYRWSILSHEMHALSYDGQGNVTSATVSINLQEYIRL